MCLVVYMQLGPVNVGLMLFRKCWAYACARCLSYTDHPGPYVCVARVNQPLSVQIHCCSDQLVKIRVPFYRSGPTLNRVEWPACARGHTSSEDEEVRARTKTNGDRAGHQNFLKTQSVC